jgi:hypothetical protein
MLHVPGKEALVIVNISPTHCLNALERKEHTQCVRTALLQWTQDLLCHPTDQELPQIIPLSKVVSDFGANIFFALL